MAIPTRGVMARLTSLTASGTFNSYPNLDAVALMTLWQNWETSNNVYSASEESKLTTSIAYMLAHDKASILRPMGGADSPIGRPGTTQPSWLVGRGVNRIRVLDNDSGTYSRELYIPDLTTSASRDQYVADLADWYARIATKVASHGGTVLCVNIAGTENGAEMSSGYGSVGDTVYTGSATLLTGIGTAPVGTLTLVGAYSTYPTGSALLLIGTERFHQTSRSGATVTLGRRAHSGSVAAIHSAGAVVKYGSAKVTQATFEGYSGPYDHRFLNFSQWAALGTEAQNRAGQVAYWAEAALAVADVLPSEIGVGLAGGQLFADNLAGAHDVLDIIGPVLGDRLWAFTTNLTDGRSYPTTHPNEHAWLLRASHEFGAQIVTQTENVQRLLEPPAPGAMQEFVDTGQFAVEAYDTALRLFETGVARFRNTATQSTSVSGDWPGGTTSEPRYMVSDSGNLQDQIQALSAPSPGAGSIEPVGFASAAGVGSPMLVQQGVLTPDGFASVAAIGSPTLQGAGLISPTGIAAGEHVGSPTLRWHRDTIPPPEAPPGPGPSDRGSIPAAGYGTFPSTHQGRYTPTVYLGGGYPVSIRDDITAPEGWFVAEDKTLSFDMKQDITAWDLEFTLMRALDGTVLITKTTGGGGIVSVSANVVEVTISGEDTADLPEDVFYRYELARTDIAAVLSLGEAALLLR